MSRKRDQILDQLDAARVRFNRAFENHRKRKSKKSAKEFIAADQAVDDALEAAQRFRDEVRNRNLH